MWGFLRLVQNLARLSKGLDSTIGHQILIRLFREYWMSTIKLQHSFNKCKI